MARDVIVLFGGDGSEHRVSVASAQNVARYLEGTGLWFWRRDGGVQEVAPEALQGFDRPFERDFTPASPEGWPSLKEALDASEAREAVFFLALHGGSGEDGTVQAELETRRIAFTGSGSAASRLAFDKHRSREALRARGVHVAEATLVTSDPATHEALGRLHEIHGRLVLKPVADGSSQGMRLLDTERDLDAAIVQVRRSGVAYLAEAFVEGRELTVGVFDAEEGTSPLPCSEVRLEPGRTFDFEGKYLGKGTLEITPAEVPEEVAASAQRVALTAHETVGCRGYSRTDVIVSSEGPVFLEINTLPGLTRASFIPQQLEAAGIPIRAFLERQIALARASLC